MTEDLQDAIVAQAADLVRRLGGRQEVVQFGTETGRLHPASGRRGGLCLRPQAGRLAPCCPGHKGLLIALIAVGLAGKQRWHVKVEGGRRLRAGSGGDCCSLFARDDYRLLAVRALPLLADHVILDPELLVTNRTGKGDHTVPPGQSGSSHGNPKWLL